MIPHTTRSGIQLQPAYADPAGQGEFPGEFPFTRGRRAQAAASGGWIQRALSGEGSATAVSGQIHEGLTGAG
jgi:methylmalonyl-CoA mutase N-terminal domain/subunit